MVSVVEIMGEERLEEEGATAVCNPLEFA